MERENKGDGNTILLTVIGVATLLVALVGATFAYFSAQVTNDSNQSLNISTAAPVGLSYVGQQFAMSNIIPGATNTAEQGKFEVTNPGTSTYAQTYDLTLIIDEDTLNTTDGEKQLLMTITSDDATISNISNAENAEATADGKGLVWDLTDGATVAGKKYQFINDQRIEIGSTHTYQMTLEFVNLETTQDHNQGKTFRAHVDISNPVSIK